MLKSWKRSASVFAGSLLIAASSMAQTPKSLTVGTASVGGTYFIYGGVVANLLSEKLGTNVSTQQTQGPNQNVILMQDGRIELGMTTMGVALHGLEGTGWAKGKKHDNIRALFPMYDTPFHFITTEKSGVKGIQDLNGKNVGVGPKAGTPGTYFPLIFDALNVKPTVRFGGASDMTGQLGDGLLDVFAFAAGLPISAFSELEAQRPVHFFGFTDQQVATITKAMPELSATVIPKGTYNTLKEDQKTVGMFNFFIAHKDLPDDVAYNIVKTVLENNPRMLQGHSAAKETIAANVDKNTFMPFHPGALRYYKEKGIKISEKVAQPAK